MLLPAAADFRHFAFRFSLRHFDTLPLSLFRLMMLSLSPRHFRLFSPFRHFRFAIISSFAFIIFAAIFACIFAVFAAIIIFFHY